MKVIISVALLAALAASTNPVAKPDANGCMLGDEYFPVGYEISLDDQYAMMQCQQLLKVDQHQQGQMVATSQYAWVSEVELDD